MIKQDTIAAISTSIGVGGIGIVRISGPKSIEIIKNIFLLKSKKMFLPRTHTIYYGFIINPNSKETIDEVLVSIMLAPMSYTKEDVVEINCHGGIISLNEVLKLVLTQGARLADAGEFTKRAFLNGRIDLSQAEAVIDIIRAKTVKSLQLAKNQLTGKASQEIFLLRESLINLLSQLELSIDFIEDDVEIISNEKIQVIIEEVLEKINKLLKSAEIGKIFKEGIKIAIIGKPNVGKSSLLNAFLNEERAIVTNIPGTTRDIIEEFLEIKGIPIKIIDTAGIRKTKDDIEKLGIERTRLSIEKAEIVLHLLDISEHIKQEDIEIINEIENKKTIFVINKIDKQEKLEIEKLPKNISRIKISAQNNIGIEELKEMIYRMILDEKIDTSTEIFITNTRHVESLIKAKKILEHARFGINENLSAEIIAIDVRDALDNLSIIIGKTVTEDILNNIFNNFCIGK